ncbi:MAG TPA: response regulator [Usitatibacter sp.]|nr:response regulator [Usitatibacter sp.]
MTPHPDADDDLDFTRPQPPAPPPAPEKVASARKEASTGSPQLQKTGFYVAMARHAGGRIPPRNGERHSIFIIEDDKALTELVGEVLAKAGFLTRFAKSRAEINAEFNKPPLPDLVLLDVSLPDADGFQILERIRSNPKIKALPVIMMTGKSEVTDVARGLTLGADGYVTKPFKISGLVQAVNTVLGISAQKG